jgi:IMP dehydrogenase
MLAESKFFNSDQALTFDDVLLVPSYSQIVPKDAITKTKLTKNITINTPILAAAMDTVSEDKMAVAMASLGGIAVIHKNNTIEEQVGFVKNVKRFESYLVLNPITISKDRKVSEALDLMQSKKISGLPVVSKDGKIEGIITDRDVKFCQDTSVLIDSLMTKSVITVKKNITRSQIEQMFAKHKVEKLVVVDEANKCTGLITAKDIQKSITNPLASRDNFGRLLVGAAIGVSENCLERAFRLIEADIDVLVLDSAHGHSENIINRLKLLKNEIAKRELTKPIDIIVGNVVTPQAVIDLCKAGADGIKVGIGPGSICTTRIVAGVGFPQLSAVMQCAKAAESFGIPVIADGGIKTSGDIAKAIAAGASSVMLGSLLAGTEESPGETFFYNGRSYKSYRGMGSGAAMLKGSADRYFQDSNAQRDKLVAEGVEAAVAFKGSVSSVVYQLVGGLKSSMGYTGNQTIADMQQNCKFIKITNAGLAESHPHSVRVTNES